MKNTGVFLSSLSEDWRENIRLGTLQHPVAYFPRLCKLGTPVTPQERGYQAPRLQQELPGDPLFTVQFPQTQSQQSPDSLGKACALGFRCGRECCEAVLSADSLAVFWRLSTDHFLGHTPELSAEMPNFGQRPSLHIPAGWMLANC